MNLPHPESPLAPKYWMYESSGKLSPAIVRLIDGKSLSADDMLLIRAYLRQWIDSPAWDQNPAMSDACQRALSEMRSQVRSLKSRLEIEQWIKRASQWGMDPL